MPLDHALGEKSLFRPFMDMGKWIQWTSVSFSFYFCSLSSSNTVDVVNEGRARAVGLTDGARKQREYSNYSSQFERCSEMPQQSRTFAPIKSYILKSTINNYFSRAEEHCAYCIRSIKHLCVCVCACVWVRAWVCQALQPLGLLRNAFEVKSQWSFLSAQLA